MKMTRRVSCILISLLILASVLTASAEGRWVCPGCKRKIPASMGDICPYCFTHNHKWEPATCTAPKTCSCGATEGEPLGHRWLEATTERPKTCSVCGVTEGEPLPTVAPTPEPTPTPTPSSTPTPSPTPTPTPTPTPSPIPKPAFIKQPQSITAEEGTEVFLTAVVEGATEYTWQYLNPSIGKWSDLVDTTGVSGSRWSELSIVVSKIWSRYQYRLVASNESGQAISDIVTVALLATPTPMPTATPLPIPVIIRQPKSESAKNGVKVTFHADVEGATSYLWQYRDRGAVWNDFTSDDKWASGINTASLTIDYQFSYTMLWRDYRLVAKNSNASVCSDVVSVDLIPISNVSAPSIINQPQNTFAVENEKATFIAKAEGWYCIWQYNDGEEWLNIPQEDWVSSESREILVVFVNEANKHYKYRYAVANLGGVTISEEVTATLVNSAHYASKGAPIIIDQPQNMQTVVGKSVTFQAKAQGATGYCWQYNMGSRWMNIPEVSWASGQSSDRLTIVSSKARRNYKYRLIAFNASGAVKSNEVSVTLSSTSTEAPLTLPVFISQPQSTNGKVGDSVTFRAKVQGATSYNWWYNPGVGSSWTKLSQESWVSGQSTDTLKVTVSAPTRNYRYRLTARNASGGVTSNEVTINVLPSPTATPVSNPVIISQPQSKSAKVGEQVTFTAKVQGATSYNWWYNPGVGSSWTKLSQESWVSGQNTDTLKVTVSVPTRNYRYRLAARNASGGVTSNEVTINVLPSPTATPISKPVIISQPQSTSGKVGDKVTFRAKVQGATSYKWQYSTGKSGWVSNFSSSGFTGQQTESLTVTVTEDRKNYKYRLVATNAYGSITSNEITINVPPLPTATPIPTPIIISQPQSVSAKPGDYVTFQAKVKGATIYRWEIFLSGYWHTLSSGGDVYGTNTDKLTIRVIESDTEFHYRLAAKNSSGTVYSNEVTLNIVTETINSTKNSSASAPVFISQPQNATANSGTKVTLHATVRGATSYHWEYSKGDGKWTRLGWDNWATGQKTDSLTVVVTPARRAYKFRLVAVNSWGSVKSNEVTITVK